MTTTYRHPNHTAGRDAVDVILDASSSHQGAITHPTGTAQHRELRRAGLVGPRGGLTRKGSIAAERLHSDQLDTLFGPE
jgi:hypothetical protein